MPDISGIQRAVNKFDGSPSRLAAAVGGDVRRQHVEHWLKAGRVPMGKCAEVTKVSGIPCADLNDRVNWDSLRDAMAETAAQAAAKASA